MPDLDTTRRLSMAKFKTVLGHDLTVGSPLTIVDKPSAAGEVDLALANRLWLSGVAQYAEDVRPTPVETREQQAARLLAGEPASPAPGVGEVEGEEAEVPADLVAWQTDDEPLKRKAGDKVTNDDLRAIAEREEIEVETDDNKAELQRKIMEGRAAKVATE